MAALTRPPRGEGRVIAGVCAAMADATGFSVTVIRVLFVLAGLVGAGEIVYIVCWLLFPKRA